MKSNCLIALVVLFHLSVTSTNAQEDILRQIDRYKVLVDSFQRIKQLDQSIILQKQILDLAVNQLGLKNPVSTISCTRLAMLYYSANAPDTAVSYQERAVEMARANLDIGEPAYLEAVYTMGLLYKTLNAPKKSLPYFREAVEIVQKNGSDESLHILKFVDLAITLFQMDEFEESVTLHLKVKNLREKKFGKHSADYLKSLSKLAEVHFSMNKLDKAEQYFNEYLAIVEIVNTKRSVAYAGGLHNIGFFMHYTGRMEEALPYYLASIDTIKSVLAGKPDDYLGNMLNNLGNLYLDMGFPGKAEEPYLKALEVWEVTSGINSRDVAKVNNNLGNLYTSLKQYAKAELHAKKSLAAREKLYGRLNSETAKSLYTLSGLYNYWGKPDSTLLYASLAKDVFEKTLGKENIYYIHSLDKLATITAQLGKPNETIKYFDELGALRRRAKSKGTVFMSEKELFSYAGLYDKLMVNQFSFFYSHYQNLPAMKRIVYDDILFDKGFLLQGNQQMMQFATSSGSDSVQKIYRQWFEAAQALGQEWVLPPAMRSNFDSLESLTNTLEKELVNRSSVFAQARKETNTNAVREALKTSEAAVEFIKFQIADNLEQIKDTVFYGALLLLPNDTLPHYIPLFEEKQLQRLLDKTESRNESVNALYAAARTGELLEKRPVYGTELYNLIWHPLDSLLQGVKTVYFSPSGLLHRVNFAALPTGKRKVLADRIHLHQMGSTRSLVVKPRQPTPKGYTAALFGGIQYDRISDMADIDSIAADIPDNGLLASNDPVRSSTGLFFDYLPGTAREARHLYKALLAQDVQVSMLTGVQATEENLKKLGRDTIKSPDILHIATHGFFFPDPEKNDGQPQEEGNAFKSNTNPMFRSGLVLAGANQAWENNQVPDHTEDGIATAYEISHLNLSNTKLVVLSACETSLGDIKGSEGVYGLQRAFKMAGADYLMVSLWKVPDQETSEFMDIFYKNWLGGKSIHTSFEKAQKQLRKKYKKVYLWGAWTLIE